MKKFIVIILLFFGVVFVEFIYKQYNLSQYKSRSIYLSEKVEQFINENNKMPLQLTDIIKDGFGDDPYWFCTDEFFDDLPGLGYCTYNLYKSKSYYEIVVGTRTIGWQTYNSKDKKVTVRFYYKPYLYISILKYAILFFIVSGIVGLFNLFIGIKTSSLKINKK